MDSERRKRDKEVKRLVSGINLSPESEAAFREELRKTASELFEKETRRVQQDEQAAPLQGRKPPRLKTWGIGLIVAGAVAVVLELPALGGLLVVVGIAAFVWDSVSLRPLHQRFGSKAQPGRFRQRL
jgi:hypothetical protein